MHFVSFSGDTKSAGVRLVQSGAGTVSGCLTAPCCLQVGVGDGQDDETAAGTGKVQTTHTVINMSP